MKTTIEITLFEEPYRISLHEDDQGWFPSKTYITKKYGRNWLIEIDIWRLSPFLCHEKPRLNIRARLCCLSCVGGRMAVVEVIKPAFAKSLKSIEATFAKVEELFDAKVTSFWQNLEAAL